MKNVFIWIFSAFALLLASSLLLTFTWDKLTAAVIFFAAAIFLLVKGAKNNGKKYYPFFVEGKEKNLHTENPPVPRSELEAQKKVEEMVCLFRLDNPDTPCIAGITEDLSKILETPWLTNPDVVDNLE